MEAEIWGPMFWNLLFDVAHYYYFVRNQNKSFGTAPETVHSFFKLTKLVLPCVTCRNHYDEYLSLCGVELEDCQDIGLNFLYPLRCQVNFRLLKPNVTLKVYKTRRIHFPLTGNASALQNLIYLLEKKIPKVDQTVDPKNLSNWCSLAVAITAPIKGYGKLVRLECRNAVSTVTTMDVTSSETGIISSARSGKVAMSSTHRVS